MDKKKSAHCKRVPCSTLTHSTNEDLLNIKRKGDPKSRTLSRTSDTTETRNLCVIQVILLACFTYSEYHKMRAKQQHVCKEMHQYMITTNRKWILSFGIEWTIGVMYRK
jgi:hypothetical protein